MKNSFKNFHQGTQQNTELPCNITSM